MPLTCEKPLKFPITKSGVYLNIKTNTLEYWFFLQGKKAKVGECRNDLSAEMKRTWEREVIRQLQKMLVDTLGAKPLILTGNGKSALN